MAVKEKGGECEEMEWSAEEEIQLYLAMVGLKPIGINKHIHMACICKRLSSALKRDVQPDTVWAHLHTMFNLEALDQMEPLPFQQENRDFTMPESEFSQLITKKLQEEERKIEEKSSDTGTRSKSTTPQPQTSSTKTNQSIVNQKSNQSNIINKSMSATTATALSSSSSSSSSTSSFKPSSAKTTQTMAKALLTNATISETPKRGAAKRTRGSISNESNSPSTTPPPQHAKRRRI